MSEPIRSSEKLDRIQAGVDELLARKFELPDIYIGTEDAPLFPHLYASEHAAAITSMGEHCYTIQQSSRAYLECVTSGWLDNQLSVYFKFNGMQSRRLTLRLFNEGQP